MCPSWWFTSVNQHIRMVAVTEMYIAQFHKQNQLLDIVIFLTMAQHWKEVTLSKISTCKSAWACLNDRFERLNLVPYDVGRNGDCYFKSVSHQLYKTADLHFEIRKAGIQHLNHNHPEYFIESISDNNWLAKLYSANVNIKHMLWQYHNPGNVQCF